MANPELTNLQHWLKSFPCDECPARLGCGLYCGNTDTEGNDCFKTFVDWAIKIYSEDNT